MTRHKLPEGEHSKLFPLSGASRWINCPGAPALSAGKHQETSIYAAEGSVAHEVARLVLDKEVEEVEDLFGDEFEVGQHVVPVTSEMVGAVKEYIVSLVQPSHTSLRWVEERVSLEAYHSDLFGTLDYACVEGDTLFVDDLKYGKGVKVWAQDDVGPNPQLAAYALGKLFALPDDIQILIENVCLTVHQPRLGHISKHSLAADALAVWGVSVLRPAVVAAKTMPHIRKPGKHCRWCPGRSECSEYGQLCTAVPSAPRPVTLPAAHEMSGQQLAAVADHASLLESFVKTVQKEIEQRLEKDQDVPGYKLVAKRANRVWKSLNQAEQQLTDLLGDGAFNKKLLSPAQAEKVLKAKGLHKEMLSALWHKVSSGFKIAQDDDPRPRENVIEFEELM
jgi:hypothetical protein